MGQAEPGNGQRKRPSQLGRFQVNLTGASEPATHEPRRLEWFRRAHVCGTAFEASPPHLVCRGTFRHTRTP